MPPNWNQSKNGSLPSSQQRGGVSETTPLIIMPSANSTDVSSSENLALLEAAAANAAHPPNSPYRSRQEQQQQQQLSKNSMDNGDNDSSKVRLYSSAEQRQRQLRRQCLRMSLGLALILLVVFAAAVVVFGNDLLSPANNDMNRHHDESSKKYLSCQEPFSRLHPVQDLGLPSFDRPSFHPASSVLGPYKATHSTRAIPTNAWYQNLIMLQDDEEPTDFHRAYAVPYVLDASGPMGGLRMHTNHVSSSSNVLQLTSNAMHGVTMGAIHRTQGPNGMKHFGKAYSIQEMTQLTITLQWVSAEHDGHALHTLAVSIICVYNHRVILTSYIVFVPFRLHDPFIHTIFQLDHRTTSKCRLRLPKACPMQQ